MWTYFSTINYDDDYSSIANINAHLAEVANTGTTDLVLSITVRDFRYLSVESDPRTQLFLYTCQRARALGMNPILGFWEDILADASYVFYNKFILNTLIVFNRRHSGLITGIMTDTENPQPSINEAMLNNWKAFHTELSQLCQRDGLELYVAIQDPDGLDARCSDCVVFDGTLANYITFPVTAVVGMYYSNTPAQVISKGLDEAQENLHDVILGASVGTNAIDPTFTTRAQIDELVSDATDLQATESRIKGVMWWRWDDPNEAGAQFRDTYFN